MSDQAQLIQTRLAMHGCIILFLGLMAGIGFSIAAATDASSYGSWRFAHLEGIINGLAVLAVAGVWLRLANSRLDIIAKNLLIIGCYANIIGPLITALFIGHRVVTPTTPLEAFVVYGFYIPGCVPLISFALLSIGFFKQSRKH